MQAMCDPSFMQKGPPGQSVLTGLLFVRPKKNESPATRAGDFLYT